MADAAMSRRRCWSGIAALPEDVLCQVLSRVGNVKDLFRFAVTDRWWLRRFTDPDFLRGLWPGQGEGHRAGLLGFFLQMAGFAGCHGTMFQTKTKQHGSAVAPTFLPAPGSPLGPTGRALTSFVADDDGTFNYAEPLAARRGIVLMQLVPRTVERIYAIITAADIVLDGGKQTPSSSLGRFSLSQLLLTTERAGKLHLHSYSAATRSWSAPTICLDNHFSLVGERSALVHQGAAHWLCIGVGRDHDMVNELCKLSVKVGTVLVSLKKLPVRGGGKPLLCFTGDGRLAVVSVYPLHLTAWTTQPAGYGGDDTLAAWPCTAFKIPATVPRARSHLDEQWFGFNRGSMLAYMRGAVFILDLEKKVMEKVMDRLPRPFGGDQTSPSPVAYEMDLVEFFVLQLDGLCRGPKINH
ncbi:hypothetical protein BS78_04G250900 [Paspalum vaginatum]|nr:hypothetical protein BS78_04G250900 [Paspalum vaginatum]